MLATGDRNKIMASYDVVNALDDGVGVLAAEDCRKQAAALDEAMQVNPVGLAVWYVAYLCAQQVGDEDAAAQRLRRFEALVRYAIDSLPPDQGTTPIRVVSPIDVSVFISASGNKLLYKFYDPFQSERYLLLRVGLWDAQRKRERWLSFDFLDSVIRLSRDTKFAEFPFFRYQTAGAVLKNFAESDPAAKAALDLVGALNESDLAKRLAAISELANGGNFQATMALARICLADDTAHCEAQAIDALLPLVEAHNAQAMIALAPYYYEGRGVAQDERAAKKLIAAANDRLGDGWGSVMFAIGAGDPRHEAVSPGVRAALEDAAHVGNPVAEATLAAFALLKVKSPTLPRDLLEQLKDAAAKGLPIAQSALAELLLAQGNTEEGIAWMRRAAELNSVPAQLSLARIYESGLAKAGIERDVALSQHWYAQAATGGDVHSMLLLGRRYLLEPDTPENRLKAQGWFQSASMKGNIEGSLALAEVFRKGNGGDEGTPADAIAIYRSLSETRNSAAARRAWAQMLQRGTQVQKDLYQAHQLLAIDADRGDAASQYQLGAMLIAGELGKGVFAEGMDWIRKSAAQGNSDAKYSLAVAFEEGERFASDPTQVADSYENAMANGDIAEMLRFASMAAEGRGMNKNPSLADKLLRKAAASGSSEAMWRLGDAFLFGDGEPKDRSQAIDWYRKSAEANNSAGMRGLASLLVEDKDATIQAEAIQWLQRAASMGNSVAMNDLGIAFHYGTGVDKDYAQAIAWYQKAIDADNSDAMANLGFLKLQDGIQKNVVEARVLIEKASERGNVKGTCTLATMLIDGIGGPKDTTRAWTLVQRAADAGNSTCQLMMGLGYRYGRVTGQDDFPNATKYLHLAAEQGEEEARAQLAEVVIKQYPDDEARVAQAMQTLRTLAPTNSRARFLLAEACILGNPWPRDGACARQYFEKAASDEFPIAASQMGMLLETDFGGPRDLNAAEKWFRKAIDAGMIQSYYELGRLLMHKGNDSEAIQDLWESASSGSNQSAAYALLRYCRAHHDCAIPQGKRTELEKQLEKMTPGMKNNVAWQLAVDVMSDAQDARYAVSLVMSLPPKDRSSWMQLDTLAAAYARAGDFENAVATEQLCLAAIPETATRNERVKATDRLERYRSHKTWDLRY